MSGAAEDCLREGIRFFPMVAESLGGWHKLAVSEIRKMTAAKARHTGKEEHKVLGHAFTHLSILIMKGNYSVQ